MLFLCKYFIVIYNSLSSSLSLLFMYHTNYYIIASNNNIMATREERRKERERRFEIKHNYWWSIKYRHAYPGGRIPPSLLGYNQSEILTPQWMRYNSWKKLLKICTPKGKKKPLINLAVRYAETLDRRLSRDYFCSGYDGQDVDYGDDLLRTYMKVCQWVKRRRNKL